MFVFISRKEILEKKGFTCPSGVLQKSSNFSRSSSSGVKYRNKSKKDLLGTAFMSRYLMNISRSVVMYGTFFGNGCSINGY